METGWYFYFADKKGRDIGTIITIWCKTAKEAWERFPAALLDMDAYGWLEGINNGARVEVARIIVRSHR